MNSAFYFRLISLIDFDLVYDNLKRNLKVSEYDKEMPQSQTADQQRLCYLHTLHLLRIISSLGFYFSESRDEIVLETCHQK